MSSKKVLILEDEDNMAINRKNSVIKTFFIIKCSVTDIYILSISYINDV